MFHECLAGRPYPRATRETQLSPSYPDSSHSNHVQGTCIILWDAYSRATRENNFSLQLALSLHTHFSHTQPLQLNLILNIGLQKIEHNYNQIWHEIKANKTHSCKLQLYNLPLWLFRDKIPKTDSRLKRKFGNSGKTHSHLI